jgi:hypothetical protein
VLLDENGVKVHERVFPGWCHVTRLAKNRFAVSSGNGNMTVLDERGRIVFSVSCPEHSGSHMSRSMKWVSCDGYEAVPSLSGNEASFFLKDDMGVFLPILSEIRVRDLSTGNEIARFAPPECEPGGMMDFIWVGQGDRRVVAEGKHVFMRSGSPSSELEVWKSREFPHPVLRLIPMGETWVGVRYGEEMVPGGMAVLNLSDGRIAFMAPGPRKEDSRQTDSFDRFFGQIPIYAWVRENGELLLSGCTPGKGMGFIVPPDGEGDSRSWNPEKARLGSFSDLNAAEGLQSKANAPKPDGFRTDFSDPGRVRFVSYRLEKFSGE